MSSYRNAIPPALQAQCNLGHAWGKFYALLRRLFPSESAFLRFVYCHQHTLGQVPRHLKSCPTNHPHHDEQGTPKTVTATSTMTATATITTTTTMILELLPSHTELPPPPMESPTTPIEPLHELPETSIVAHTPGWTIFRNLYMSSGALFILSTNHSFPEIRLMTSTGLIAENTPENIAAREPTSQNMDFITPEEARQRWGGDRNCVWSVEGNTVRCSTNHSSHSS